MVRARCVRFVEERGFGFVVPLDGGRDIFVHITKVPGEEPLEVGELVDVEIAEGARGPFATFVERVA